MLDLARFCLRLVFLFVRSSLILIKELSLRLILQICFSLGFLPNSTRAHFKAQIPFSTNTRVILRNLEKTPQYNGETGLVVGEFDPKDSRLPVRLSSGAKILRVRPENLELAKIQADKSSPIGPQPESIAPQQLGADSWAPGSLNPSKLPEWAGGSLERAFSNFQFSLAEAFASNAGCRPVRGTDPAHDVKETLLILARNLDSGKRVPMLIQDDSQDEGIAIQVTAVLACDGGTEDPRPLLVVHYWSDSAESPSIERSLRGLMSVVSSSRDCAKLRVATAEVVALRTLLTYNAERLDPAWAAAQAAAVPDTFSLSYLTPLGRPEEETVRLACTCGAKAPKRRCTRCGIKWYCSKECQVSDWHAHKTDCRSLEDRTKAGDIIVVRIDPGAYGGMLGLDGGHVFVSTGLFNTPVAMRNTPKNVRRAEMRMELEDGAQKVVKIQVPAQHGGPLLVYDKARKIQTMISPANTAQEDYARLARLIRERGVGGLKGFFSATVMAGGTELHVDFARLLPAQQW